MLKNCKYKKNKPLHKASKENDNFFLITFINKLPNNINPFGVYVSIVDYIP